MAVACTLPFLWQTHINVYVSPETRGYYNAVESVMTENQQIRADNVVLAKQGKPLKREKVVLVDSPWGPGAIGEVKGQTEALFEHCLRDRIPFIVIALDGDPLAPSYTDNIMKELLDPRTIRNSATGNTAWTGSTWASPRPAGRPCN